MNELRKRSCSTNLLHTAKLRPALSERVGCPPLGEGQSAVAHDANAPDVIVFLLQMHDSSPVLVSGGHCLFEWQAEQRTLNPQVAGSSLAACAILGFVAVLVALVIARS